MAQFPGIRSERQMLQLLAQGAKEFADGNGIDLETVMAEADALLAAEDS